MLQSEFGADESVIRQKMALACRMLAVRGHCSTLAGQVTVLNQGCSTIFAPTMGISFEEIRPQHLIEVDFDFVSRTSGQKPNPATLFHLWIYRHRPDVRCIIHTHPPYASALSMLGIPLHVAQMDMCMFYDDCAHLKHWPGVPIADEEGRIIANALADKRSILLANHGPLVVGKSIEEALYLSVMLEDAARLQLLASAAGKIQSIGAKEAKEAHDFLLQDSIVNMTFQAYSRQIMRAYPDVFSDI
jgi:L-fuculose-phosphate aldolase